MVKMIYALRRLKSLSLEEFQTHWLEYHSQFGRRVKSLRRYVQYHTLADDPIREAMAQAGASHVDSFDGISCAWFDDLDTLRAEMNDDVVKAAIEDEKHFIEMEKRYFGKLSFRKDPALHAEQFKIINVATNEEMT